MTKKELRYAFDKILAVAENVKCEDLHHPTKHQHLDDEMCKAVYHIHRQVYIVREYIRQTGILPIKIN